MPRGRALKIAIWSAAVALVGGAVLWFVPTDYVIFAPGVTGNLAKMVHVAHAKPVPGAGKLLMVAITVQPANELLALAAHLDPALELVKRQQVMGNLNMQQYVEINQSLMQGSQIAAEMAGERLAGLPAKVLPGAVVEGVLKNTGAQGKLHVNDVITKVGPYAVASPQALRNTMRRFRVGEIVPVTVLRNGSTVLVPVRTGKIAGDPDPALGVYVGPRYYLPRPVSISAGNIGGPSAGLMFALEIYEQITGRNLTHGLTVAGTGEITPQGQVQAIGGVGQKVVTVERAGAQVFFCPVPNYAKAAHMAALMHYRALRIVPVASLQQAVGYLDRLPAAARA